MILQFKGHCLRPCLKEWKDEDISRSTARSRRTIKHRGRGPSITGRPTNPPSLRLQLEVGEDHKFVRHQIPSRKGKSKTDKKSLAKAVASNRSSERKH